MEQMQPYWDIAVTYGSVALTWARTLPPDALLAVTLGSALTSIIFLAAWIRARRRPHRAEHELAQIKRELADVQVKYGAELARRMTAEMREEGSRTLEARLPPAIPLKVVQQKRVTVQPPIKPGAQ